MDEFIPSEQLQQYRKTFMLFDDDADEMIAISNLATVLRALGQNPTEEEVINYRNEFDPDNNGVLDFESFRQILLQRLKKDDKEEELLQAFRAFDKQNRGIVKSEELKEAMLSLCTDLNEDQVDDMLKLFDPDGSGEFNYHDLAKKMIAVQKK